ncbi:MAG: hypothetical protein K8R90_10280 [Candidatus Cloacimonetes bacterium]|nr:hypothetical protein [Candidatus Cloacimonadota bacterium]
MNTIRQNTVWDLINRRTKPTVSTDKNIAFVKTIYSTVDEKEDLGIEDANLVLSGAAFPPEAKPGQVFIKGGKSYIYKEQT